MMTHAGDVIGNICGCQPHVSETPRRENSKLDLAAHWAHAREVPAQPVADARPVKHVCARQRLLIVGDCHIFQADHAFGKLGLLRRCANRIHGVARCLGRWDRSWGALLAIFRFTLVVETQDRCDGGGENVDMFPRHRGIDPCAMQAFGPAVRLSRRLDIGTLGVMLRLPVLSLVFSTAVECLTTALAPKTLRCVLATQRTAVELSLDRPRANGVPSLLRCTDSTSCARAALLDCTQTDQQSHCAGMATIASDCQRGLCSMCSETEATACASRGERRQLMQLRTTLD